MRAFLQQLRQETGIRLLDKVFDSQTDKPSKVLSLVTSVIQTDRQTQQGTISCHIRQTLQGTISCHISDTDRQTWQGTISCHIRHTYRQTDPASYYLLSHQTDKPGKAHQTDTQTQQGTISCHIRQTDIPSKVLSRVTSDIQTNLS